MSSAPTAGPAPGPGASRAVVLLGQPNTGKSTLFNRLTGLRQKTANYPGTTIQAHVGALAGSGRSGPARRVVDLPGVYSLDSDTAEGAVCRAALNAPQTLIGSADPPVVCVALSAAALREGLRFFAQAARFRLPVVVALTMVDVARRRGVEIDTGALARSLGCRVVAVHPRTGAGAPDLVEALADPGAPPVAPPADEAELRAWIDRAQRASAAIGRAQPDRLTDRLDWAFTHPVIGVGLFAVIMAGLFWLLFRIAVYPMTWIEAAFEVAGAAAGAVLPEGLVHDLVVGGIVPGIAGAVVFLPQICLLFFLLSLLEDTGYLARAAFVADRVLRRFGLPGTAFIPLLSSHACAIPGIMAARAIPDRRQRLATILVAPFMTCSARLPVYALLVSLLFAGSPGLAALAFVGCYALGASAGIASALLARATVLRGACAPMTLELPAYQRPSLRTALLTAYDRGVVFLKKAGVFIFLFSVVLWWLTSFPRSAPPPEAVHLRAQAESVAAEDPAAAERLLDEAERAEARRTLARSFAGRVGHALEPVFAPLGFDWRINIGVLTSFAAREVFVSTMAVVFTGDQADAESMGVIESARSAVRDDGATPVFSRPASWALLVFFVLAMQCFSTTVVTARETGSWRWAALQFGWMTLVAYMGAAAAHALAGALL